MATRLKEYHRVWLASRPHRSEEWLLSRMKDGFDIHHLDGNHENNDSQNLCLIEHTDHMMLHNGGNYTLGRISGRGKDEDSMDSLIRFRVATEDRAKFEAAAERAGQSLSDWIRTHLLAAADGDMVPVVGATKDVRVSKVEITGEKKEIKPVIAGKVFGRRPDPDKIAAFQRKAGMAGGKGKR